MMSGVVEKARHLGALAVAAALLAGCGGSTRKVTVTLPAASPSNTAMPSPRTITLPPSSNGPTTCTVYESGYATQVIFESQAFDVRAECRAWTRSNAGEGYLWGYEPISAKTETAESIRLCHVTEPQGNVTATVIEDTGFVSVSAAERANGSSACESLLAFGWTERRSAPTTATTATTATRSTPTTGPELHRARDRPELRARQ
jgi:hypothetical protein